MIGLRHKLGRLVAVGFSLWAALFLCTSASAACSDAITQARRDHSPDITVEVPYFFGLSRDRAQALANDACLTARFTGPTSNNAKVVVQSVPAGRGARARSTIVLRMAIVDSATVPSLVGLSHDAAAAKADAAGFKLLFYGPSGARGVVVSQSRPAGQTVARGSFIQLQMGPSKASTVPDFVGRTRAQAEAMAAASHLDADFSGPDDPAARVTGQRPEPGAQVPAGTTEQLQMAIAQSSAPNILNRARRVAQAVAARRGLVLDVTGDQSADARVVRQSPGPGTRLDPGAHLQAVMAVPVNDEPAPGASAAATQDVGPIPTGIASVASSTAAKAAMTQVPDLTGKTRAEVQGILATHGLSPDFLGDASAEARAGSQSPSAGESLSPNAIVNVVMVKPAPALWPWLAGGGGALALGAGGFLYFRKPARGAIISMRPDASPPAAPPVAPPRTPPPSVAAVTYTAVVDQGRPTVRLAAEPAVASRALVIPSQSEGQS